MSVTPEQLKARAVECGTEIAALYKQGKGINLKMARLMVEAMDGKYHALFGLSKFEDWLGKYSNMEVKPREAFDLMKIVRGASKLGVDDDTLIAVPTIKLKHIFGLDADKNAKVMKQMIGKAKKQGAKWTHEQVKTACENVKAGRDPHVDEDSTSTPAPAGPKTYTLKIEVSEQINAAFAEAVKLTGKPNAGEALGDIIAGYAQWEALKKEQAKEKPLAMAA